MPTLRCNLRWTVDLPEPSDVVALPNSRFLIVSDKVPRAAIVGESAAAAEIALAGVGKKKVGLEAVAYDPSSSRLYVCSEERAVLSIYGWSHEGDDDPSLEAQLDVSFGERANKGIEGMVHLSATHAPTGEAGLLFANEGSPRGLFFVASAALADGAAIDASRAHAVLLDPVISEACLDFSGLAFDPASGRVLLCSDESSSLVELTLQRDGDRVVGKWIASYELVDERGRPLERVEGVAVHPADASRWVLLEDDCTLCRVGP